VSLAESFLPEFDAEMASTRKVLARVPADRLAWKPHPKSRSLGELATHVTELARWGIRVAGESFQVGSEKAPEMKTAADFLSRFDQNVSESRASILRVGDSAMEEPFRVLKPGGEIFFQLRRREIIRFVLFNHAIHHRGQLTVYFRQNDVPLPTLYGPTADENV
jgi:uncharacterized damage-inducible protein DinB